MRKVLIVLAWRRKGGGRLNGGEMGAREGRR